MATLSVRTSDDKVSPESLNINPHYAYLDIDDDTGLALTTPTTATVVGGSPMTVQAESGLDAATDGTITVTRAGTYEVDYALSEITPVNSQVITLEVYLGTTAKGGKQKFTNAGTAVAIPSMSGMSGPITCAVGEVLTLKVIASTGNFTVKRAQIRARQIAD
jgi:hypothetical protein